MPLKPDSKASFDTWLASMKQVMPEADYAALADAFGRNEAAQQHAVETVLMKSDYSRLSQQRENEHKAKMNELAQHQARLTQYDREAQEWEQFMLQSNVPVAQFQAAQAELAQLKQYRAATEAKIKELGMTDVLDDINAAATNGNGQPPNGGQMYNQNQNGQNGYYNPPPNGQQGQPPVDPRQRREANFATTHVVENLIQEGAVGTVIAHAQLMELAEEYRTLTGKPLPGASKLVVEALKENKPVLAYIEDKFKFPELRHAAAEAAKEAEIERRATERAAKIVSERQMPIPTGMHGSPVLAQTIAGIQAKPEDRANNPIFGKPGQVGRAANLATEAFLTRKYANQSFNPWTQG